MPELNVPYFTQLPGLLKPAIFILQMIMFICLASVAGDCGSGWSWFFWLVLILSMIVIVACSCLLLFGFWDQMPFNKPFIEFVYSASFTVAFGLCAFIGIFAATGASAKAGNPEHGCNGSSAYGAFTFFAIMTTGIFGLNTFGHYTMWKNSDTTMMPPAAAGPGPHGGV